MNRKISIANQMTKGRPTTNMKATTCIAITGALLTIAAHWLAGHQAAKWKMARLTYKTASASVTQQFPPPSPILEVVPQPTPQPSLSPVLPSERIPMEAALNAASRMRLAALSGLGSDFAACWDSDAVAQAWLSRLEFCSYKHIWPYFFSGALLVTAETEPQIVAYYSPYADAALLTEWSRSSDGDRISNAAVVLGSEIANAGQTSETDPPRWCKQDGPLFERLVQSHASFRQKFPSVSSQLLKNQSDSSSLGRNRSLQQLEKRCLALTVELTRLCATRSKEPSAACVVNLMNSLARGKIDELPVAEDDAKSNIQKLGSERLARMRPAFATQFSDGCLVLLMDACEPATLMAAHFSGTQVLRLETIYPKFFP